MEGSDLVFGSYRILSVTLACFNTGQSLRRVFLLAAVNIHSYREHFIVRKLSSVGLNYKQSGS